MKRYPENYSPRPRIFLGNQRAWLPGILALVLSLNGCAATGKNKMVPEDRVQAVGMDVMSDHSVSIDSDNLVNDLFLVPGNVQEKPLKLDPGRANRLHYLGDLYLSLEIRLFRQEWKKYNRNIGLWRTGRLSQRPKAPRINHKHSRMAYEQLLAGMPGRPENDRVLYQLARIYEDLSLPDKMVGVLKRLVEKYPGSPLREEAEFRLAEAYFESGDFKPARRFYRLASNSTKKEFYEPALYKLGWTEFFLHNYPAAVDRFSVLVDSRRVLNKRGKPVLDPKVMSATDWDYVLELIRGISLSFSNMGPPSEIEKYYRKKGSRDYEDVVYRRMGDLYLSQKRFKDAIKSYQTFIRANPYHEEAPFVQLDIIEAYQGVGLVSSANRARRKFVEKFGPETEWTIRVSPEGLEAAVPVQKQVILDLALFSHSEAQRTKRKKDFNEAIRLHKKYLAAFPGGADSARINFLLGEALYEAGRFLEAAEAYEKTAYGYPVHSKSSEAGYAAVLTLEQFSKKNPEKTGGTEISLRVARSGERFWEAFPSDPRARAVLWKAAETFYRNGEYSSSRKVAREIVNAYPPKDENSIKAQKLIATAFFEEGLYEEAAGVSRGLSRIGGLGKQGDKIAKLWASSLYKQAESSKKAGKLRQAQTEFMRVHAEVPGSDIAAVALFDAGNVALARERIDEAVQLFQIQLQRYPSHRLTQKVPGVLLDLEQSLVAEGKIEQARLFTEKIRNLEGTSKEELHYRARRLIADGYLEQKEYGRAETEYWDIYQNEKAVPPGEKSDLLKFWASAVYKLGEEKEKKGDFSGARKEFLRISEFAPESEVAPVALYDAGRLARRGGEKEESLRLFTSLVKRYPNSSFAVHAGMEKGRILEESGDFKAAAEAFEAVVKGNPDARTAGKALWSAAGHYERIGNWGKAGRLYRKYLDQYPGEIARAVEAFFKSAQSYFKEGRDSKGMEVLDDLILRYGKGEPTSDPEGFFVAKAYMRIGDGFFDDFSNVQLVSPLEETLARKKELMTLVIEKYTRAGEYNFSEIKTEVTQKIGNTFEIFGVALLKSERPGGLSPQQLEQYEFLLEEQAYPFEEKAISAYESNVRRAQKQGIFDDWVKESYQHLAGLFPARYRKPELKEALSSEPFLNLPPEGGKEKTVGKN